MHTPRILSALDIVYTVAYLIGITSIGLGLIRLLFSTKNSIQMAVVISFFFIILLFQMFRIYWILHQIDHSANDPETFIGILGKHPSISFCEKIVRLFIAAIVVIASKLDAQSLPLNAQEILFTLQALAYNYIYPLFQFAFLQAPIRTGMSNQLVAEFGFLIPIFLFLFTLFICWDLLIVYCSNISHADPDHHKTILPLLYYLLISEAKKLKHESEDNYKTRVNELILSYQNNGICYFATPKFFERIIGIIFLFLLFLFITIDNGSIIFFLSVIFFILYFFLIGKNTDKIDAILLPFKNTFLFLRFSNKKTLQKVELNN